MQDSDIPTKISVPFAKNAGGSYTRIVPVASQIGINAGWASFNDGFVPLNFTAIGAGGIPPFGQDMNGILNAITKWTNWYNAGAPVFWDSAFSTAVGGYPKGAVVSSTTFGQFWMSTTENNVTNPNAGGAGWVQVGQPQYYSTDLGIVNTYSGNFPAQPTAHINGVLFALSIAHTNTGASTFDPGPGPKSIYFNGNTGRSALYPNMMVAGAISLLMYDGTQYELVNPVLTPSGTTNLVASVSGVLSNTHYVSIDAGGNIVDSGHNAPGSGSALVTSLATLTSGIMAGDGLGNIIGLFSPTGSTGNLASWSGATPAGPFVQIGSSGNLQSSGLDGSSFDAAGVAAALALWTWSGAVTLALGSTNYGHSLGLNPIKAGYRLSITCTSADAGYSVGDVIHLSTTGPANSSNNLLTVTTDAAGNNTTVIIGVGVTVAHKSTFASTNLTLAKWNLQIGVIPNH